MMNIGTILAKLKLDDKLTPALIKAQQSIKNVGPKLKNLGSTLTKNVTLGMAAAAAATITASETIQKAFRAISSTTGATGDALEGLTASFTEVFTQVPQGAEEVAGALADINTISGATGSVLEGLTKNVLDASRMLGENAGPNAIGFARALEQFQRPATEGTNILDRFFRISQETGSGLGDLIRKTNEYGGVLKNAGFSMEESAVLFGRLESSGISVSRVMPGLNAAFRKSADAGENSRAMLDRVINSMKAAKSDTQALSIATEIFGAEGAQRMTVAVRNGTFALDDLTSSLSGAEGGIQAASAESQTLSEVMGTLRNKATSALAPFGDELKAVLISFLPLLESLGEHIKDAAEWFSKLSPGMKKTIIVIVGLTAAAGPLLWIVGQLAIAFGAVSFPVLAVVVAVGAAVAALFIFRKEIMGFINKGINFLVDGFQKAKVALGFMTEAEYEVAKAQREAALVADENAEAIEAVTNKLKDQQPVQQDVIAQVENQTGKVKELTEAQKKYHQEINDQIATWRTGGIPEMEKAIKAYRTWGGTLDQLTKQELKNFNQTLEEGIERLRLQGEAVPLEENQLYIESLDKMNKKVTTLTETLAHLPKHFPGIEEMPLVPLEKMMKGIGEIHNEALNAPSIFSQWGDSVKGGFKSFWQGITGGTGKISGMFQQLGAGVMQGFGQIVAGGMTSLVNKSVEMGMKAITGLFKKSTALSDKMKQHSIAVEEATAKRKELEATEAQALMDLQNNWRGAEEAAERYNIGLKSLGDTYQAAKWSEETQQLADDWELLALHGKNLNTIAKKMAPTVQEMIEKYQEAGIAIPDSMKAPIA